jgi:tetratricopeptide (TPR) repeat protein
MLATLAAFWPTLHSGFLTWDDGQNLLGNPYYRGLGWRQLRWMFTTFHFGNYQPLSWLCAGLEHALWGMDPFGYHLTSLLWHMVNAALFFFMTERLLGLAWKPIQKTDSAALSLSSAVAALLFALHPLRVEAVAWLSDQHDLIAGAFYLLAIQCYLRADEDRHDSRPWLAGCFAMFTGALLSKSNAMTLPFVLLILDFYPLRRLPGEPRQWILPQYRPVWREKLPFLAAALAAAAVSVAARERSGMLSPFAHYPIGFRIQQTFYALAFYIGKTLLPARLSPFYPIPADLRLSPAAVLTSVGSVLTLSAASVYWRRRWPAGLAAWAFYIVTLLPVLGLVSFSEQIAADRYTYLSCMAWAVLSGAAAFIGLRGLAAPGRRLLAVGLGVALFGLAVFTWRQAGIWRDSETLYRHALAVDPEIAVIQNDLGIVLLGQGRLDEAIAHLQRAAALGGNNAADYHHNLGFALAKQGRMAEAIVQYRQALALRPDFADTRDFLRFALAHEVSGWVRARER